MAKLLPDGPLLCHLQHFECDLEKLGQGHDLNMPILAIGGIQMFFLGH
jgi:hypothetical protein